MEFIREGDVKLMLDDRDRWTATLICNECDLEVSGQPCNSMAHAVVSAANAVIAHDKAESAVP